LISVINNKYAKTDNKIPFKSKKFDPADFHALVSSRDEYEIRKLVDKIFQAVDKDQNGTWSFGEVKEMFKQIWQAQGSLQGLYKQIP